MPPEFFHTLFPHTVSAALPPAKERFCFTYYLQNLSIMRLNDAPRMVLI